MLCPLGSLQLERTGSPHALRLTKTTEVYQQAVKQHEADLKLLAQLDV